MNKEHVARWLANRLRLPDAPTTAEIGNSAERLSVHEATLARRPMFRLLVNDLQADMLRSIDAETSSCVSRTILEIGAGVIPLSALTDDAVSSDIVLGPTVDCLLSASDIPLRDSSLRAVVAQNSFHHLPDHARAIREMARVVEPGGVIVILEPYHGLLARRVYPTMFPTEGFDAKAPLDQVLVDDAGDEVPNQAVSYIVFDREWATFSRRVHGVSIIRSAPLPSGLRYLGTGGLNFRQLIPTPVLRSLRWAEATRIGSRLLRRCALHWTVTLKVVE